MNTQFSSAQSCGSLSAHAWGGWVHIFSLVGAFLTSWMVGFGGMLPAFILWLCQSDKTSFVARHAAECFNFNLSLFVYFVTAVVFCLFTLGLGLLVVLPLALLAAVAWFVCSILAAKAGFEGKEYNYPLTLKILK